MTKAQTRELGLLARVALIGLILLMVAGVLWYGVAFATIQRVWRQLLERPYGPMAFRFILQPSMAAIAAFLRVRRDARAGRSPYFWRVIRNPEERLDWLREGLNATARIILLGLLMDAIYQAIVFKRFYPDEAVIIAVLLGFVPYVIFRGVLTPVLRRRRVAASTHQT